MVIDPIGPRVREALRWETDATQWLRANERCRTLPLPHVADEYACTIAHEWAMAVRGLLRWWYQ